MYEGKKVLVTGGTGTIGPVLVKKLLESVASVTVVSIDPLERVQAVLDEQAEFIRAGGDHSRLAVNRPQRPRH